MKQKSYLFRASLLIALSLLTGCRQGAGESPAVPDKPTEAAHAPTAAPTAAPIAPTTSVKKEDAIATASAKAYEESGFVAVGDVIENAILEVRYYTAYNFIGERIDGYHAPIVLLSREAAAALKNAADDLTKQGYVIKIFDGYRPQQAVDHFVRWAKDSDDQRMKGVFYPDLDKSRLFSGYIAKKSGHSRGSTVDLTIVDMKTGIELDMGTPFDFLSERSNHGSDQISSQQAGNREILKKAMEKNGFKPYSAEWWHYTLIDEPYPDTYFDFPVE